MRIGVIGCGYWGSKHVRVLQQMTEVEQVVVIDPREERLVSLVRSFPSLRPFPNLDEALDHLDALVVATPPSTHFSLAQQAIAAGKHVLVEKPITTSTASARRLIELAKAASITLMVGHTFEYNPAVWKLREIVRSGELGNVYYIDAARLNLGLYQPDINVIWDLAPHDISIANYILGDTPTTVQGWGSSYAHAYLEDVAYLRLSYEDLGVTAQIHVSWLDPCKVRRVTVVGGRKMAVYNDLADQERIRIYDRGVEPVTDQDGFHELPMSYRHGDIVSPFIAVQEPLAVQDHHFVECIELGKQPLTDGRSGLAVVKVLEAVDASLRHRIPVALDDIEFVDLSPAGWKAS
jgi:predicted dehydrogenase